MYVYNDISLLLGEAFQSLHFLYRISAQAAGQIIHETCAALYTVLQQDYLQVYVICMG